MYVITDILGVFFKKAGFVANLLLFCTGLSSSALAQPNVSSVTMEGATISLLAAPAMSSALLSRVITLEQDEQLAFVEVELDEGWKTYWRLPGRFGIAPVLDWSASENVVSAEALFPMPTLFDEGDGTSIGYTGDVLWPMRIQPRDPKEPIILRLSLDIGLCEILCLPVSADLTRRLSPGSSDMASLSDILDLASQLPSEPDVLPPRSFDHSGEDLTLRLAESIPIDSFAVVENAEGGHTLLRAGPTGTLHGHWRYLVPPNRISLIRPESGIEIFRIED